MKWHSRLKVASRSLFMVRKRGQVAQISMSGLCCRNAIRTFLRLAETNNVFPVKKQPIKGMEAPYHVNLLLQTPICIIHDTIVQKQ